MSMPHVRLRTSGSKGALGNIDIAGVPLIRKFAPEGAARLCELRKSGHPRVSLGLTQSRATPPLLSEGERARRVANARDNASGNPFRTGKTAEPVAAVRHERLPARACGSW